MNSGKILLNIGSVTSIIGGGISIYGFSKFREARRALHTLRSGDEIFGINSSKSIKIWEEHSGDYRLILIIGCIILIVGIILLISSVLLKTPIKKGEASSDMKPITNNNVDISKKLEEIEKLKLNNLISEDEYNEIRKKIIENL